MSEHLEDLIFNSGYAGAQAALDYVESLRQMLAEGTGTTTKLTVKWDGCIHPDSVVETTLGKMRIEDVIDTVNESLEEVSILQFNFESQTAEMLPILNAVKKHGPKRWVLVELDNGNTLTLTEDHEVYTTNRGWVAAGKLTHEDDIKDITNK